MIEVPGYKIGGVLFTEEQIKARTAELGRQISADYAGKDLLVVGVLKGSFIFMADLVRNIDCGIAIDFMAASSYGSGTETSGNVRIKKDIGANPAGRHVLLVEDIVDTGVTLKYLRDTYMAGKGAESVKVVSLLDKPSRRRADITPDYCGFSVDDLFVIGYGLDYDEKFRELPHITYLEPVE